MTDPPQRGYIYFTKRDFFFGRAVVGEELRIARRSPPWLVVSKLDKVLFAGWPGEFFLAEVVDPISEDEQEPFGGPPASAAGYTRAAAVRIIDRYHLPCIFGSNGDKVAAIIDAAGKITSADAHEMIQQRHVDADEIRDLAKQIITNELNRNGSGQGAPFEQGSPLGALYFLDRVISERAVALVGDVAFDDDPDDDEGAWLAEPWASATNVLWEATLAIGAPEILSDHLRAVLLQGSESFRSRR